MSRAAQRSYKTTGDWDTWKVLAWRAEGSVAFVAALPPGEGADSSANGHWEQRRGAMGVLW